MRRACLAIVLAGCAARAPRLPDAHAPGLVVAFEEHVRDGDTTRVALAIDGTVLTEGERAVHLPTLAEGEHTIHVLVAKRFRCGLGPSPSGRLVIRASRTFIVDSRPKAEVVVTLDEGSIVKPMHERLRAHFRASGDGITEADGCDFGPSVSVEGCDLPASAEPRLPLAGGQVRVLGEVLRPGSFEAWSAPTVAHAICRAGGKTVFASLRVVVRRADRIFRARFEEHVEPGDVVVVQPICGG